MKEENRYTISKLWSEMSLSVSEIDQLNKNITAIYYEQGEVIAKQGSDATHVFIIEKGIVTQYVEEENRKQIIQILNDLNLIMCPQIYSEDAYPFTIKALMPSIIYQVRKELFFEVILENKMAIKFVYNWYNTIINCLLFFLKTNLLHNNAGKIALVLYYLDNFNSEKCNLLRNVNNSLIAQMVGISVDSAGKILTDFKKDNIIELNNDGLKIINRDLLSKICRIG